MSEKILSTIEELQEIRTFLTMNREVKGQEKASGKNFYEEYLK